MTRHTFPILPALTLLAALVLALLVLHKGWTASFTHDESFTYNHYVAVPLMDALTFRVASPNNHLLNTLLMKGSSALAGPSEAALRMPNLLAFIGFLAFMLLILRRLDRRLLLPVFLLVVCNPYLLDFFALARGNGLSYFFLSGSLFHALRWDARRRLTDHLLSTGLAVAGVVSHGAILYFFAALVLVVNGRVLSGDGFSLPYRAGRIRELVRINLVYLAAGVVLFLILYPPMKKLSDAGQFFYGGDTGFWKDTVGSLAETFLYGRKSAVMKGVLQWMVPAVLVSAITLLFLSKKKNETDAPADRRGLIFLLGILLLTVLVNVLHFHLTGTKLLIRRYGLLYWPIFMLVAGFLSSAALRIRLLHGPVLWFTWLAGLVFAAYTFASFSPVTYLDWEYETASHHVMRKLDEDLSGRPGPGPFRLGSTWLYEPTANFYRATRGMTRLSPADREGPTVSADYYYVLRGDLPLIPVPPDQLSVLYQDERVVLIRAENAP